MREISHTQREQRRIDVGIAATGESIGFPCSLAAIVTNATIEPTCIWSLGLGAEWLRVQQMERGEESKDYRHNRLQIGLSEAESRVRSRESWILRTNYYSIDFCIHRSEHISSLFGGYSERTIVRGKCAV